MTLEMVMDIMFWGGFTGLMGIAFIRVFEITRYKRKQKETTYEEKEKKLLRQYANSLSRIYDMELDVAIKMYDVVKNNLAAVQVFLEFTEADPKEVYGSEMYQKFLSDKKYLESLLEQLYRFVDTASGKIDADKTESI